MAVELFNDGDRKFAVISWDKDAVQGDVVDIATANGDDRSGRLGVKNDGLAVLTYPLDFVGSTDVTVTGVDGGSETGTISIK
jgi:hypothetical protein